MSARTLFNAELACVMLAIHAAAHAAEAETWPDAIAGAVFAAWAIVVAWRITPPEETP